LAQRRGIERGLLARDIPADEILGRDVADARTHVGVGQRRFEIRPVPLPRTLSIEVPAA
jgi:hypothetical protein